MNPLQMASQIKHELELVVWPGVGGEVVFGTRLVHVYAGELTEEQIPQGDPFALVSFETGEADPDDPELINQTFSVLVGAKVDGDPLGEAGITGGATSSLLHSANRGVGEIAARVRAAIGKLYGSDGARMQLSTLSMGAPTTLGRGRQMTLDEQSFRGVCTGATAYSAPQSLKLDGSTWTWSGGSGGVNREHVTSRYDFVQYRLGYKAGATPAATPADLDATVFTGVASTVTEVGAAATGKTYSIFAEYNHRGSTSGVIEGASPGDEIGATLAT